MAANINNKADELNGNKANTMEENLFSEDNGNFTSVHSFEESLTAKESVQGDAEISMPQAFSPSLQEGNLANETTTNSKTNNFLFVSNSNNTSISDDHDISVTSESQDSSQATVVDVPALPVEVSIEEKSTSDAEVVDVVTERAKNSLNSKKPVASKITVEDSNSSAEAAINQAREREELIRAHARERQTAESMRRAEEVQQAMSRAREVLKKQEEERKRRMDEVKRREEEHRHLVEERRRKLLEAENERKQAMMKKAAERSAKLERLPTKRTSAWVGNRGLSSSRPGDSSTSASCLASGTSTPQGSSSNQRRSASMGCVRDQRASAETMPTSSAGRRTGASAAKSYKSESLLISPPDTPARRARSVAGRPGASSLSASLIGLPLPSYASPTVSSRLRAGDSSGHSHCACSRYRSISPIGWHNVSASDGKTYTKVEVRNTVESSSLSHLLSRSHTSPRRPARSRTIQARGIKDENKTEPEKSDKPSVGEAGLNKQTTSKHRAASLPTKRSAIERRSLITKKSLPANDRKPRDNITKSNTIAKNSRNDVARLNSKSGSTSTVNSTEKEGEAASVVSKTVTSDAKALADCSDNVKQDKGQSVLNDTTVPEGNGSVVQNPGDTVVQGEEHTVQSDVVHGVVQNVVQDDVQDVGQGVQQGEGLVQADDSQGELEQGVEELQGQVQAVLNDAALSLPEGDDSVVQGKTYAPQGNSEEGLKDIAHDIEGITPSDVIHSADSLTSDNIVDVPIVANVPAGTPNNLQVNATNIQDINPFSDNTENSQVQRTKDKERRNSPKKNIGLNKNGTTTEPVENLKNKKPVASPNHKITAAAAHIFESGKTPTKPAVKSTEPAMPSADKNKPQKRANGKNAASKVEDTRQQIDGAVATSPNPAAEENKEDEYKRRLMEKRRLAREKAERQAQEEEQRQQQIKQEEEERLKREEEERVRREQEELEAVRRAQQDEQERLERAIAERELQLKREEEERVAKLEAEAKAREELESKERERAERFQKEEAERLERKKRLEMIMKRVKTDDTKSGDCSSPSKNSPDSEAESTSFSTELERAKSSDRLVAPPLNDSSQNEIGAAAATESSAHKDRYNAAIDKTRYNSNSVDNLSENEKTIGKEFSSSQELNKNSALPSGDDAPKFRSPLLQQMLGGRGIRAGKSSSNVSLSGAWEGSTDSLDERNISKEASSEQINLIVKQDSDDSAKNTDSRASYDLINSSQPEPKSGSFSENISSVSSSQVNAPSPSSESFDAATSLSKSFGEKELAHSLSNCRTDGNGVDEDKDIDTTGERLARVHLNAGSDDNGVNIDVSVKDYETNYSKDKPDVVIGNGHSNDNSRNNDSEPDGILNSELVEHKADIPPVAFENKKIRFSPEPDLIL